jgi:hypothetical protein
VDPVTTNNVYRGIVIETNTFENSLSAAGYAVDITTTDTTGQVDLNVGGFKFAANDAAVGFAALSATASVDWTPTPNGDGNVIYSITGAWGEIITGFSSVFVYQERNGVKGFQYNLGDKVWDCGDGGSIDCVVTNSAIGKDELNWSPIAVTESACPTGSGYNASCRVYTLSSIGSLKTLPFGNVIQITIQFSNQKVLVKPTVAETGHEIGPDYCKIDIDIWYPWAKIPAGEKATGNIAIVYYVGGRAGDGTINGGSFQGKEALVFVGTNDKATVMAFDGQATLDGVDVDVYINGISGSTILGYDCVKENCDIVSAIVIYAWQVACGVASAGGWTSQLVILSWDSVACDHVYYDPTAGMADTSEVTMNAAGFVTPTIISFIWAFILFLFHGR